MLKNAVALVTGGASGLGRATVERLAREGTKVVLCDINQEQGEQVAKSEGNITYVQTDVTSEADVRNALNVAKNSYGGLDIVVNCAGVAFGGLVFASHSRVSHTLEDFTKVLTVNTIGTFNVMRLACELLHKNDFDENGQRGVIINTASTAAYDGRVGQAAYAASKAAIVGMTLPGARELSSIGIRLMTIAPGLFDTPSLSTLPPKVVAGLIEHIPFPKRLGKPSEFAQIVMTIIQNPMLTAETIRLDGAMRMP